jgi:hypothetical protein
MHRRDGCNGGCGSGGDARLGRGGEVGPADASQPKWVLVTTRDRHGARPGATAWLHTQLG